VKPKETKYKGYWFRSRLEAKWAVFFDALGLKWLYEPEGFDLHFDYEDFIVDFDMDEEELLELRIPQVFKALDGRKYSYLPDFFLPELNYWIEVKGPNPNSTEMLKGFFLSHLVHKAARQKSREARTDKERAQAHDDLFRTGVYILYGDIPWPFPERGNALGYRGGPYEAERLWATLGLCWQQCRLCSRIGIGSLRSPYCKACVHELENFIYYIIGAAGETDRGHDVVSSTAAARAAWERITPGKLDELDLDLPADREEFELLSWAFERKMRIQEARDKHDGLAQEVLNLEFFTSGHKTPALQNAYDAARSARFEHGASPRPSG
jgi:hypothetical protein